MRNTFFLSILILLMGCDLGSKSDQRRSGTVRGGGELQPGPGDGEGDKGGDTNSVVYIESEDSRRLKSLMLDTIENFTPNSPVAGEKITYIKTYSTEQEKSFILPTNNTVTCVFNSASDIFEEEVLQVLSEDEFMKQTSSYPDYESAQFVSPTENKDECENNIAQLKVQNTEIGSIKINRSDAIESNRKTVLSDIDYLDKACKDVGDFADDRCTQHEIETSLIDYELSNKKYRAYQTVHTFAGAENEVEFTWTICYQAPYFSIGYECLIDGDDPKFEDKSIHDFIHLKVLDYTRP